MKEKINNYYEKVVASLKDAYYRISVIDLEKNQVVNVKLDQKELEKEAVTQGNYDALIEFCAQHYVHPVDRIKFLQLSNKTYLQNAIRENRVLSAALKDEEQYRQALLKGEYISYDFNISQNRIESPIMEYRNEQQVDLLKEAGMKFPCSYEQFIKQWKTTLLEDSKELLDKYFGSCKALIQAYENGKRLISQDFSESAG